jgi:phosphoglycolate phosphatase-like HAD superfamily hydrolase
MSDPQALLRAHRPEKEFFIGIDSDGCAFDTMEVKHKDCFCPMTVKHWGMAAVAKYAREAWDFVNLYSKTRGCNRFLALTRVLQLVAERPEVKRRGVAIPAGDGVRAWTGRETRLGNPALAAEVERTGEADLKRALAWSQDINKQVSEIVRDVGPFAFVRESLEKVACGADLLVVSATPIEALEREWREHDIAGFTRMIAGQEHGSKQEHLALAAGDKYEPGKVLMIGDAPGDMRAAKANAALFYPINPGGEEQSWQRFHDEAAERFFAGSYAGEYEARMISEFERCLPEDPPWKR